MYNVYNIHTHLQHRRRQMGVHPIHVVNEHRAAAVDPHPKGRRVPQPHLAPPLAGVGRLIGWLVGKHVSREKFLFYFKEADKEVVGAVSKIQKKMHKQDNRK